MSFFARLFGNRQSELEREIHEEYVQAYCSIGHSRREAGRLVAGAIALCKREAIEQGTNDLPENCGNSLLEAASEGDPTSERVVGKLRREGATDHDIVKWWNTPDLIQRMIHWSNESMRFTLFSVAVEEEGLSPKDAMVRVNSRLPHYGDSEDESNFSGDDRPLPHELLERVGSYRDAKGVEYIQGQVETFSSYNAFVRHEIRGGSL